MVSFETMEALRWLAYLKTGGKVVVNDYQIPPAPTLSGKIDYPSDILEELKEKADTTVINAAEIAEEVGNARTMNIVLLGALVKAMNLTEIDWEAIIKENIKEGFVEVNLRALEKGMNAIS